MKQISKKIISLTLSGILCMGLVSCGSTEGSSLNLSELGGMGNGDRKK